MFGYSVTPRWKRAAPLSSARISPIRSSRAILRKIGAPPDAGDRLLADFGDQADDHGLAGHHAHEFSDRRHVRRRLRALSSTVACEPVTAATRPINSVRLAPAHAGVRERQRPCSPRRGTFLHSCGHRHAASDQGYHDSNARSVNAAVMRQPRATMLNQWWPARSTLTISQPRCGCAGRCARAAGAARRSRARRSPRSARSPAAPHG